jgi:hypothetical protein
MKEPEMNVCNTHEIQVLVVSPGEAEYGTAEFWSGGRQIGFTGRTASPTPSPRPTASSPSTETERQT